MNKGKGKAASQDVLVAVMGITGSGKSTFISHCTDLEVGIGSSLKSYTQNIEAYPYSSPSCGTVRLVDTPGFDDTNRTDEEILRLISTWLTETYKEKILLRGILYLHRITDDRMQGTAKNNLFLLKKLCGKEAMKNMVLVTTMWENLAQHEDGQRREEELKSTPDFWGEMVDEGSRVERHYNHKKSAIQILERLLSSNTPTILTIQQEMVDQGMTLEETNAGLGLKTSTNKKVERLHQHIRRLEEDIKEAKEGNDKIEVKRLRKLRQSDHAKIEILYQQQEQMNITFEQLRQQQSDSMQAMEKAYEQRLQTANSKFAEQQKLLNKMTAEKIRTQGGGNYHNFTTGADMKKNHGIRDFGLTGTRKTEKSGSFLCYDQTGVHLQLSGRFYHFSKDNYGRQIAKSSLPRDLTFATPFWDGVRMPENQKPQPSLPYGCPRNASKIWFGYQGSYVAEVWGGMRLETYWDLRGQYEGLEKLLQTYKKSDRFFNWGCT